MYRILDKHSETRERRAHRIHPVYAEPELVANGPNQVWSWDITKLRGPVKYSYFLGAHGKFTTCARIELTTPKSGLATSKATESRASIRVAGA